jgi:hypothetical protein
MLYFVLASIALKGTPMQLSASATSEAAILHRVIEPDKPTFSPTSARDILALDFSQDDKERMHELSLKAQEGTLTAEEEEAITNYERVGHLITSYNPRPASPSSVAAARTARERRTKHAWIARCRVGFRQRLIDEGVFPPA